MAEVPETTLETTQDRTPDKPVYLLTGSDRPKVDTALARLRRHFQPESSGAGGRREASGVRRVRCA